MISLEIIIIILLTHYIADFCWQTHWQASNKSRSNKALLAHVSTYTIGLFLAGCWIFPPSSLGLVLTWTLFNAVAHFCVDYLTSRASSKRWAEQKWHDFFAVIGLDQLIHYVFLFTSYIALT